MHFDELRQLKRAIPESGRLYSAMHHELQNLKVEYIGGINMKSRSLLGFILSTFHYIQRKISETTYLPQSAPYVL